MTHTGSGDPALASYYPAWLDNLAGDVTLEGSMMDGFVQGAEAMRTVIACIRSLSSAATPDRAYHPRKGFS